MAARILDGRRIADEVRATIAARVEAFIAKHGVQPHLAAVLVGSDPASQVYVKNKRAACEKAGMASSLHAPSRDVSTEALLELIAGLNEDRAVHGILVQLPLPGKIDERRILRAIDPGKDVDGLHPENVGLIAEGHPRFLPCTPFGVVRMLEHGNIPIAGAHVVIVGRSQLVGRPLSMMLSQKGGFGDATVTLCHSRTVDLPYFTRQADILVAAIGKAECVTAEMIKPGATVVDVGINRTEDGRLVGDVDFANVVRVAGAITPVPGGVGRMTVTMLLENTLAAARLAIGD